MQICSECNGVLGLRENVCPQDGAPATEVEDLPIGAILGGYRIVGELGDGGMGVVYEANHEVLGRRCAVKLLRPEYSENQQIVTRFLQEAKAVNLINNKHIVNVYDYGDDIEGLVYFVMEFLEGQTLSDLMGRYAPMPAPLFTHVFAQVLQGLAAAHENQIVHRDLKFENVFVITKGNNPLFIKLLDFGVAKLRGEHAVDGLTVAGQLIGTPKFMSPEQFRGKPVDTRSDVFSLGIMMYAAATGKMPFGGQDLSEIALGVIKQQPSPVTDLVPTFPEELVAIINKALEKEPEKRFADARAMQIALFKVGEALDPDSSQITAFLREHLGDPNADVGPVVLTPPPSSTRSEPGAPAAENAAPKSGAGLKTGLTIAAALAVVAGGAFVVFSGSSGTDSSKKSSAPTTVSELSASEAPDVSRLASSIGGPSATTRKLAEKAMLTLWGESSAAVREQLVASLAQVGSEACVPLLILALGEQPPASVSAAEALAEHGTASTMEALFGALKGAGPQLRLAVATSLLKMGDSRAQKTLQDLLSQPRHKTAAAVALSVTEADKVSMQVLTDVMVETPPWKGHWLDAASALLKAGDAKAEATITAALGDEVPEHRALAAAALARAGHKIGVEHLGNLVADARSEGRGAAALVLAQLGNNDALLFVPVGLMSDDEESQIAAIAILSRLGGPELRKQSKRLATLAQDGVPALSMAALAALANSPD